MRHKRLKLSALLLLLLGLTGLQAQESRTRHWRERQKASRRISKLFHWTSG